MPEAKFWRQGIYDEIRARMHLQGSLRVKRMCKLAEVGRAGFYRYLRQGWGGEEEAALRSAIQEVALEQQGGPAQMEAWMKPGIKGRRDVSVTAIVDRVKVRLHRVHATAR